MEPGRPGWMLFDRRDAPAPQSRAVPDVEDRREEERRLFCALCGHPVTHLNERVEVSGGHEHRCTNPGGYSFHIGCFREAGGCVAIGDATDAHTWFKGYAWRVALCAGCDRHLGWRFEAAADHFHGLILDRLASAGRASGT